jgi:long-chain acyl-CoA synthetase
VQSSTPVVRVISTNIKEYLPPLTRLLFTLFRERKEGHRAELAANDYSLPQLLRLHRDSPPPTHHVVPEDHALLMFTGGTTGLPKAAVSTHHGLLMAGMQITAWMQSVTEPWRDTTLLLMPLFHSYGNVGIFSAGVVACHTLAPVPDPRDLDDVIATIGKVRPAFLCGVPTLFIALLNHPLGDVPYPSSRKVAPSWKISACQSRESRFYEAQAVYFGCFSTTGRAKAAI